MQSAIDAFEKQHSVPQILKDRHELISSKPVRTGLKMKYNCVLCKTKGIDKRAETWTQFAGYEMSVCQECANKIHPEYMVLKEIIRTCLDQTLRDKTASRKEVSYVKKVNQNDH